MAEHGRIGLGEKCLFFFSFFLSIFASFRRLCFLWIVNGLFCLGNESRLEGYFSDGTVLDIPVSG